MSEPTCGAESLWPGVTCEQLPHDDDHHSFEDDTDVYVWTTAAVEADRRGECAGCRRRICVCPCSCPGCSARKAATR